jgi:hypothetical protein
MSFISNRPGVRNLLELVSSYRVLACLLVPMSLWLGVMSAGGIDTGVTASSRAFQLFYLVLFFGVAIRCLIFLKQRRHDLFLSLFGILLILLSGMYRYGLSFTGTVELGAMEPFSRYQKLQGRKWGMLPALPLALVSAPAQNFGKAAIAVAGAKKELAMNGRIFWRWYSIKLVGEGMAPFLIIDEDIGNEEKAGFVRLPLVGDKPPYFTFGNLPHRFYLSLPDKGTVAANGVTPAALKLGIRRGKLNVLTKDVKIGELVKFEGHSVRFENGAPWVRLEVKDQGALYLVIFGALFVMVGGISSVCRISKRPGVKV